MQRITINVKTGEKKLVDLTPEEVAEAETRTAAEAVEKAARPKQLTLESLAAALKSKGVLDNADIEAAKK